MPETKMSFYKAVPLTFIYYCVMVSLVPIIVAFLGAIIIWEHPAILWNEIQSALSEHSGRAFRVGFLTSALGTVGSLWNYYSE